MTVLAPKSNWNSSRPHIGRTISPSRSQRFRLAQAISSLELLAAQTFDPEVDHVPKLRRLEAALFLSKEGISSRKIAKIAGLADATEARTLIRELNEIYDQQGRAFRVEDIAGGYAILTRGQFSPWLQKMGYVPGQRKLSQTAMETLAVVAYRQPVLRAEIEAIRGVGCSEVLKQLMEYELVKISGRSEDLGRPYLYGTTRRFLQMFGLRSADRLPRMSWVNEPMDTTGTSSSSEAQSEAEDSAMTHTSALTPAQATSGTATATLEEAAELVPGVQAVEDEENPDFLDEDGDDAYDDDDDDYEDDDFDDGEWDDDEEEESEDESDEESDDLEEESEWEEVDDDDDGWVDDDDDEEEEDDWGNEEEGEDEDWD